MTLIDRPGGAATTTATTAATVADPDGPPEWTDVCSFDALQPDLGVCALVGGVAVAVFRCWPDDELYALANIDPFSDASVLSRGIVGSIGDAPVVASPVFKHRFDLRTGVAIDDPSTRVAVYDVLVIDGRVLVSSHPITVGGAAVTP